MPSATTALYQSRSSKEEGRGESSSVGEAASSVEQSPTAAATTRTLSPSLLVSEQQQQQQQQPSPSSSLRNNTRGNSASDNTSERRRTSSPVDTITTGNSVVEMNSGSAAAAASPVAKQALQQAPPMTTAPVVAPPAALPAAPVVREDHDDVQRVLGTTTTSFDDETIEPPFQDEHELSSDDNGNNALDNHNNNQGNNTRRFRSMVGRKRRASRKQELQVQQPQHQHLEQQTASHGDDDDDDTASFQDAVTGNWSLEDSGDDDSTLPGRRRRRRQGRQQQQGQQQGQQQQSSLLSREDIEICQRLDQEYDRALEERQVGYTARYNSVRQSACFAVAFMSIFLTLGTVFFMRQAAWGVADSLLFSIYTITTVGYGSLENPETDLFQLYTIFFIFIGIATLTIMVAQVYQCIALEASRAQHSRDKPEMARRGRQPMLKQDGVIRSPTSSSSSSQPLPVQVAMMEIHPSAAILDWLFHWWERARVFFRENEYGRGLSVLFPFVGLITVGAAVIGPIEGWSVVESLYFAVVSLTTVGFGDFFPTQTASIWFCILWLPFSVGFMSLFLTNVAAFYIRLSDKNIARIERHLRRRIQRAKERAEKEREAALTRAMRGQQYANATGIEIGSVEQPPNTPEPQEEMNQLQQQQHQSGVLPKRRGGFDTIPTADDPEAATGLKQRGDSRHLFGSPEFVGGLGRSRRDRILMNSITTEEPLDASKRPRSSMKSMKEILRTVHNNLGDTDADTFHASGPESEFLSMRSTYKVNHHSLRRDHVRKPSFALRVLVQERFSEIIATDIAGYQSSIEIKENTLSVTIDTLKGTADKWLVPRRARRAFRAVAFEALYFCGEHGLITRGADALYDLSPFEFHGLFSPLLAALGDAETMEGWLASTNVLAEVDLRRDPSRPSLAQFGSSDSVSAQTAARVHDVLGRATGAEQQGDLGGLARVTTGNAFSNR